MGKLIFSLVYILIFPALLLFLSGDWLWTEGWIFSAWFTVLCFTTIIYLYVKDPALLSERYKQPGTGGQKGWDKFVVYGLMIGLVFSFFFFFRSYADNTFLSPLVRVQTERKQQVVTTGVYGFVRHPLYLGGILLFVGTPALLGSLYGMIIGVLMMFLLAYRITGEEKMLEDELEGYAEYKKRVKYRLVPFIW